MTQNEDRTCLRHIYDAAQKAVQFTAERERDDLTRDEMLSLAIVRLIEIIGEAAKHLSESFKITMLRFPGSKLLAREIV